jgi:hypothetical protein
MSSFEAILTTKFFAALEAAGLPEVPREFSVVPQSQIIPRALFGEIDRLIGVSTELPRVTRGKMRCGGSQQQSGSRGGRFVSSVLGISTSPRKVASGSSSLMIMGQVFSLLRSSMPFTTMQWGPRSRSRWQSRPVFLRSQKPLGTWWRWSSKLSSKET